MSNNLDTTTITEGGVSPWGKVIELLKTSMDPETYDLWLKPVRQVSFDGTRLVLGVPNRFFNDWILNHCKDKMESALRELAGPQATLELVIFQDQQLPPQ